MSMAVKNNPSFRFLSPFRYPGGKSFIAPILSKILTSSKIQPDTYVEPFAGGAAGGLRLLANGVVSRLELNDLDKRVYAAWDAILHHTDRFLDRLSKVNPTMSDWYLYREVCQKADTSDSFELGFSTFMLNRLNRSGIVLGAAPIGGYAQTGKWRLDARLYKTTLLTRIAWIGSKRDCISISSSHANDFLAACTARLNAEKTFYFFDPPYVKAGSRLYFNGMTEEDHKNMYERIIDLGINNWLITYDNHSLVREIYKDENLGTIDTRYSLNRKRKEKEIIIFPEKYSLDLLPYLGEEHLSLR